MSGIINNPNKPSHGLPGRGAFNGRGTIAETSTVIQPVNPETGQPFKTGDSYGGGTVVSVDPTQGPRIKMPNGKEKYLTAAAINSNASDKLKPFIDNKGSLDVQSAVQSGITDPKDYKGFDVSAEVIQTAQDKALLQPYMGKGGSVQNVLESINKNKDDKLAGALQRQLGVTLIKSEDGSYILPHQAKKSTRILSTSSTTSFARDLPNGVTQSDFNTMSAQEKAASAQFQDITSKIDDKQKQYATLLKSAENTGSQGNTSADSQLNTLEKEINDLKSQQGFALNQMQSLGSYLTYINAYTSGKGDATDYSNMPTKDEITNLVTSVNPQIIKYVTANGFNLGEAVEDGVSSDTLAGIGFTSDDLDKAKALNNILKVLPAGINSYFQMSVALENGLEKDLKTLGYDTKDTTSGMSQLDLGKEWQAAGQSGLLNETSGAYNVSQAVASGVSDGEILRLSGADNTYLQSLKQLKPYMGKDGNIDLNSAVGKVDDETIKAAGFKSEDIKQIKDWNNSHVQIDGQWWDSKDMDSSNKDSWASLNPELYTTLTTKGNDAMQAEIKTQQEDYEKKQAVYEKQQAAIKALDTYKQTTVAGGREVDLEGNKAARTAAVGYDLAQYFQDKGINKSSIQGALDAGFKPNDIDQTVAYNTNNQQPEALGTPSLRDYVFDYLKSKGETASKAKIAANMVSNAPFVGTAGPVGILVQGAIYSDKKVRDAVDSYKKEYGTAEAAQSVAATSGGNLIVAARNFQPGTSLKQDLKKVSGKEWIVSGVQAAMLAAPFLPKGSWVMAGATGVNIGVQATDWKKMSTLDKTISVAFDVAGLLPAANSIAKVKIASVKVPLENGETVTVYKGLSAFDKPLIGKSAGSIVVGGKRISYPKTGDIEIGYEPVTKLETKIMAEREAMKKMGFDEKTIAKIEGTLKIEKTIAGKPSPDQPSILQPQAVKTMNAESVTQVLKEVVETGPKNIKEIYGSGTIKANLKPELQGWRQPNDMDIQTTMGQEGTEAFANRVVSRLEKTLGKENVRISKESPTLVEVKVDGEWHHAVDIHSREVGPGSEAVSEGAYGFAFDDPTIKVKYPGIGEVDIMSLSESSKRKLQGIGRWQSGEIKPYEHRLKDVADEYTIIREYKGDEVAAEFARLWDYDIATLQKSQAADPLTTGWRYTPTASTAVKGSPTISLAVPANLAQVPNKTNQTTYNKLVEDISEPIKASEVISASAAVMSPRASSAPLSSVTGGSMSVTSSPSASASTGYQSPTRRLPSSADVSTSSGTRSIPSASSTAASSRSLGATSSPSTSSDEVSSQISQMVSQEVSVSPESASPSRVSTPTYPSPLSPSPLTYPSPKSPSPLTYSSPKSPSPLTYSSPKSPSPASPKTPKVPSTQPPPPYYPVPPKPPKFPKESATGKKTGKKKGELTPVRPGDIVWKQGFVWKHLIPKAGGGWNVENSRGAPAGAQTLKRKPKETAKILHGRIPEAQVYHMGAVDVTPSNKIPKILEFQGNKNYKALHRRGIV